MNPLPLGEDGRRPGEGLSARQEAESETAPGRPLTRTEAIRLALEHCDTIRVVSTPGNPISPTHWDNPQGRIMIARVIADTSIGRFQGEVMALVRSVSQKFGTLHLRQVQLAAVDRAVRQLDTILQDDACTGCTASKVAHDRATIEHCKNRLRSDRAKYAAELLKAEGELRSLLGRPVVERRITAVAEPCDAHVEFDLKTCLRQMSALRPELVEQEFLCRIAQLLWIIARNQLVLPQSLPAVEPGFLEVWAKPDGESGFPSAARNAFVARCLEMLFETRRSIPPSALGQMSNFTTSQVGFVLPFPSPRVLGNARFAQYSLLRQRARQSEVKRLSIRSLVRLFLVIDARQKQASRATRRAEEAAMDVEFERVLHAHGWVPVDLLLDAIARSTTRLCAQAECRRDCDDSIVALEETKGTLLKDEGIAIVASPGAVVSSTPTIDTNDPAQLYIFHTNTWRLTPSEMGDPAITSIRQFEEGPQTGVGAAARIVLRGGGSLRPTVVQPWISSWALPPSPVFPGSTWFELQRVRFQ